MTMQPDELAEDAVMELVEPQPSPVDDGPQDDFEEDGYGVPV